MRNMLMGVMCGALLAALYNCQTSSHRLDVLELQHEDQLADRAIIFRRGAARRWARMTMLKCLRWTTGSPIVAGFGWHRSN